MNNCIARIYRADRRSAYLCSNDRKSSDLMLTRMGASSGELIVEGTFDKNLAFCQALGALRPKQRLVAAEDAAGTARVAPPCWRPPACPIAAPTPGADSFDRRPRRLSRGLDGGGQPGRSLRLMRSARRVRGLTRRSGRSA